MTDLARKVAWITGAGSGIGEAAALALAAAGATVVLTGRRAAPLDSVAERVRSRGGIAMVQPADATDSAAVAGVVQSVIATVGRLDILVNNAGLNVAARSWAELTPASIDTLIAGNLASAFYCASAVLPTMRAQGGGQLIHTASWAGRWVSPMPGPTYTAAKHAVVAMSHSLNMEEFAHGIRSTVICPEEVATPILDRRPVPVSAAERARMLQASDVADLILYVAGLPPHVCLNEVVISPTWNRGYAAMAPKPPAPAP